MIRRMVTAGLAVLAAIGASVVLAAPAQAQDFGDGTFNCVNGEICFRKDRGSDRFIKHFYNASGHAGYLWTNNGGNVAENASNIRNRDTVCSVGIEDFADFGENFERYFFPRQQSDFVYVGDDIQDDNNAHVRC